MNFKLCSFNLFNYIAPPAAFYEVDNIYTRTEWELKCRWIDNKINSIQPDIIGFQEVFSPQELKAQTQELGYPYFATVDDPELRRDYVYDRPVVALASKFPIETLIPVCASGNSNINKSAFRFSRLPIKAKVRVPGFGVLWVYVTHLKSPRPVFNEAVLPTEEMAERLFAEIEGRHRAQIQRSSEALYLYRDILVQLQSDEGPVVLMGDMNAELQEDSIACLLAANSLDRLDGKPINDAVSQFSSLQLYDAFEIASPDNKIRKATHYHRNLGRVIDHILVSAEFNPDFPHSLALIESYIVVNDHLENPKYQEDAQCSDHAIVCAKVQIRL